MADGWQPHEDAVATQSQRLVSIVLSDTAQQRRHAAGFTKYLTFYHKFIVTSTYDSDLKRAETSFGNIVS